MYLRGTELILTKDFLRVPLKGVLKRKLRVLRANPELKIDFALSPLRTLRSA